MHIEPGVVHGAKMALAYATAAGGATYAAKMAIDTIRENGTVSLAIRAAIATASTFIFFELLPHFAVGVSEVHFILGSTLLLMLGAAPAAIGLALGLLIQSLFFAPTDLPMIFVNLTTLMVPLFAISALAKKIIAPATRFIDLSYAQALKLSTAFQGGIVAWVAFWVFYGQGFGADTMASVLTFGGAYMLVVIIEPIADLAILAAAKSLKGLKGSGLVEPRLYETA